jgi:hypothetical protein
MGVNRTRSGTSKRVILQPASLVDDRVITDPESASSYFVSQPVKLAR